MRTKVDQRFKAVALIGGVVAMATVWILIAIVVSVGTGNLFHSRLAELSPMGGRKQQTGVRGSCICILESSEPKITVTFRDDYEDDYESKDFFEDFNLREFRFRGMRVGEKCYTVPWAMEVTAEGKCLLKLEYIASTQSGGTVQLMIEKKEDGFYATLVRTFDHEYEWDRIPTPGYQKWVKPPSGFLPITYFSSEY